MRARDGLGEEQNMEGPWNICLEFVNGMFDFFSSLWFFLFLFLCNWVLVMLVDYCIGWIWTERAGLGAKCDEITG